MKPQHITWAIFAFSMASCLAGGLVEDAGLHSTSTAFDGIAFIALAVAFFRWH